MEKSLYFACCHDCSCLTVATNKEEAKINAWDKCYLKENYEKRKSVIPKLTQGGSRIEVEKITEVMGHKIIVKEKL